MVDDDTTDFADYPETIGQRRSNNSWNACDWSPRDVLIDMLRQIDRGVIKPDALVVAFREKAGRGRTDSHFAMAGPDIHTSLGLIEHAKHQMLSG